MTISRRAVCSALPFLLLLAAAFFSMSGVAEAHHRCGHAGPSADPCAPPPTASPTASYTYSPAAPEVSQAVSFDGRGSSCAATPCSYRWEKGTEALGTGATLTHSFSTVGNHQIKLVVTDAQSRSASTTKTITVSAPATGSPVASYTYSPSAAVTGQEVAFDGTGSSCSTTPCSYTWEGDGADGPGGTQWPLGSGETLKFTFSNAGNKYVRLTVLDAEGRSDSTVKTVTVSEPVTVRPLIWSGGFEPGDLSEWGLVQTAAPDRAQIVTSPVTQGTYALKLTVKYGDVPTSSGSTATNRAQINGPTIHQEGEEDYTRISMLVPSGFPVGTASNDFQVAYQWHGAPHTGSPPVSIDMNKDRSQWRLGHSPFEPDGDVTKPQSYRAPIYVPLTKDVWHHFIYRVKWSRYSSVGFFEVWHAEDGQKLVKLTVQSGPGAGGQRVLGPTLHSNMVDGLRPIAANYRRQDTTTQDGTIFYDGVAVGDSFSSVWP